MESFRYPGSRLRSFSDPLVWSNLLFVWNSVLWFRAGFYLLSGLLLMSALASFGYHRFREGERVTSFVDRILAVMTLLVSVYTAFPRMFWFGRGSCVALLALSLYVKSDTRLSYTERHFAWHILVCMGQALLATSVRSALL